MATKRITRGKAVRLPNGGSVTIHKSGAVEYKAPAKKAARPKRKRNPAKPTKKRAVKRNPPKKHRKMAQRLKKYATDRMKKNGKKKGKGRKR